MVGAEGPGICIAVYSKQNITNLTWSLFLMTFDHAIECNVLVFYSLTKLQSSYTSLFAPTA